MGVMTFLARKGAVGGTARWVAKFHNKAINDQTYDIDNLSSLSLVANEINKVVEISLSARQQVSTPEKIGKIREIYYSAPSAGFVYLVVAILKVEAGFSENDQKNVKEFLFVIDEELEKKGAGVLVRYGVDKPEDVQFTSLLFWAAHKH